MMYLSATSNIMRSIYGSKQTFTLPQCVEAMKKAGYDRIDVCIWSFCGPGKPMDLDNWEDFIAETAEACRKFDLPVYQTHGNTHSGMEWDDPEYDHAQNLKTNLRAIRGTKMLGGEWMVVHPKNLPRDPLYNAARAKEANLRYLAPLIEEAKKVGVGLAVENMVDFGKWRRRYCGGDIYELIDLVDTINDPSVGICLDTGHANMSGIEAGAAVREIGSRLKCTHINDNHDNGKDEHLFPYFGTLDWKDLVRALKEINYEGDFSYESGSQRLPVETRDAWLKYTVDLGRDLLKIE